MTDILKDVIYLTLIGGAVSVTLSLLMAVFKNKISGLIQKVLWVLALLSMVLPVWKLIPEDSVDPILIPYGHYMLTTEINLDEAINWAPTESTETDFNPSSEPATLEVSTMDMAFYVWALGAILYIGIALISYFAFLFRKKRNSIKLLENPVLEEIKQALNIKRKIRIRECKDSDSPFLTGVLFPVIYLPEEECDNEEQRMIYLHELTHFKHKDLLLKWFAFFVNAIHWFNPLCYVIVRNINRTCEIHCDMSVTKHMSDEEKKLYMNTIINLVARK